MYHTFFIQFEMHLLVVNSCANINTSASCNCVYIIHCVWADDVAVKIQSRTMNEQPPANVWPFMKKFYFFCCLIQETLRIEKENCQ